MPSYLERMPVGFEGCVSRPQSSTTEPVIMGAALAYGKPVKMVDGQALPLADGDDASLVYGILIRPTVRVSSSDDNGYAIAGKGEMHDVLRRGYLTVKADGAVQRGGKVFVKTADGSFAATGGEGLIQLPTSTFMGEGDASGLAEVAYNI